MAKWLDTSSRLYRWRYIIGYVGIILTFVAVLLTAALQVPGGLSEQEKSAFITSASLDVQNIDSMTVPSLPFHIAQRITLDLMGPSLIGIKLSSIIIALLTGIGAVLLMRRWFKPNVALLATAIMVTTGQFIFVAQLGTPAITYIMWPVWLLLVASMITASQKYSKYWKFLFFILVPLSLYTPLNIYLVVALVSAGLLHPHVRYVIRRMSKWRLALLILMSLLLLAPLAYFIYRDPSLGAQLLGVPATWPPDLLANAKTLFGQYFTFMTPESGITASPVLGLGSFALVLIGAWRLFKIRYTARSYTLVAWAVLLIPVLIINPAFITVTFVPLLMLLANGLEFLQRSWYRMFPRNPYARFVGLIPLVILVSGLMISGLNRYFSGYEYDPVTARTFSHDLSLLETKVRGGKPLTLVVGKDEMPFYNAIANLSKPSEGKLTLLTDQPVKVDDRLAATREGHKKVTAPVKRIITTASTNESDRFYIY